MPRTITITDATLHREYRVFEVPQDDGTSEVWASIGYTLETDAGDRISRSSRVQLTGTARSRALALFQDIKALVIAEERI